MNTSVRTMLTITLTCLTLSACGGGGSTDPGPPNPSKARINSSNYTDAVGLAASSSDSSSKALAATTLPFEMGMLEQTAGLINCPQGGTLSISVANKTRTAVPQNCKSKDAELISGSLTLTLDGTSGLPQSIQFKDMKTRGNEANATITTLNGEVTTHDVRNGHPTSMSSKLSVSTGTRTDLYELTLNASGGLTVLITSPSFDGKVKLTIDPKSQRMVVSSSLDQSSATISWSTDQKTITVELRETETGPVVLSKTLTDLEWLALLRKWT